MKEILEARWAFDPFRNKALEFFPRQEFDYDDPDAVPKATIRIGFHEMNMLIAFMKENNIIQPEFKNEARQDDVAMLNRLIDTVQMFAGGGSK